ETVSSLRVAAAAVLNLSEDHLDWHRDIDAYAQSKARIFKGADLAVVNRGDARVAAMVPGLQGLAVRSFGPDEPELAGDLGIDVSHGMAWLSVAALDDFGLEPAPRRKKDDPPPQRSAGRRERLMPVDALQIRGAHN